MSVLDEIKASFKSGNSLIKLIYVNIAVFLAVKIVGLFFYLFSIPPNFSLVNMLAVPADLKLLILRPWTIISYMFLHESLGHIFWNLIILYSFGRIFLQYFGEKKLISVYLLGGISGAALYILFFNMFPVFNYSIPMSIALGASASVMAILIAVATYKPRYEVNLFLLLRVEMRYIALALIIVDIVLIDESNAGGHIAHLGGALFGYLYISQMKRGKNITKGFDRIMDKIVSIFKPRPKVKVSYRRPINDLDRDIEYNKHKKEKQQEVDIILDKIAKSGYDSLSKKEKETLFKNSN